MKKLMQSGMIYIILGTIAIIGFSNVGYTYLTAGEKIITVNKLTVKRYNENDMYLIMSKENGVFKNVDSIPRLKFNSSDLYNELEVGAKYKIKYYGWRIKVFSMYSNIYEAVKQ